MSASLVAHTIQSADPGNLTTVTTGSIDTTTATLIVCGAADYSVNPGTVTDNKSNTWTALTAHDSSGPRGRIYYCQNPTVGTGHTFTLSDAAACYPTISVQAWSGVDTFDVQNGAAGTVTTIATGSVTPSVNNEIVVALLAGQGDAVTGGPLSIDSGMTATDSIYLVAGVSYENAIAYKIQTTAAAINPTWSWDSSSLPTAACIATFKLAGATVAAPLFGQVWL